MGGGPKFEEPDFDWSMEDFAPPMRAWSWRAFEGLEIESATLNHDGRIVRIRTSCGRLFTGIAEDEYRLREFDSKYVTPGDTFESIGGGVLRGLDFLRLSDAFACLVFNVRQSHRPVRGTDKRYYLIVEGPPATDLMKLGLFSEMVEDAFEWSVHDELFTRVPTEPEGGPK